MAPLSLTVARTLLNNGVPRHRNRSACHKKTRGLRRAFS
jgi:hypothetical protein